MKIKVQNLRPGMILAEDVYSKSGRPIVEKNTVLTNIHIKFIRKFLVKHVTILLSSSRDIAYKRTEGTIIEEKNHFINVFEEVVGQYKSLFSTWRANIPVNMYHVRQLCLPLFEQVETNTLSTIKSLLKHRQKDLFYYKSVAVSLLAIKLAQKLNYEKKDWLQIGFAAILIDIGLSKSKLTTDSLQADNRHPIISYEMIKDEPSLSKHAKLAILQHHERLDGTGYPMKLRANKIHPFARIISVSDRYFSLFVQRKEKIEQILLKERNKLDEHIVRTLMN